MSYFFVEYMGTGLVFSEGGLSVLVVVYGLFCWKELSCLLGDLFSFGLV